jgi:hypothetical protein
MMERRRFLKLLGFGAVGATMGLPFGSGLAMAGSTTVSCGGKLYRSKGTGKVYVSDTGGKSWKLHSDLGASYSITRLAVDKQGRLNATVRFRGWSFGLVLASNLKSWLTT